MIVEDYLNLITSEYRQQPNFQAVITAFVALPVRVQELLQEMIPLFDIDVAVGQQLDVIGQWVGISRHIDIPITGVYFSWDDTDFDGWDFGTWQPNLAPVEITELPDDAYRTLIRAKIAANHWDGTTDGAYAIWDVVFPNIKILIQDNQDMSYAIALVGGPIDSLTVALLVRGYLNLKPEGVRISEYFVSVDDNPMFAWDLESALLGGWDEASWARELDAL